MKNTDWETGVIGGIEKRKIKIVKYNNDWHSKFLEHKNKIQNCLGDIVIGIEHIGSTSVPNLSAKPIICLLYTSDAADE